MKKRVFIVTVLLLILLYSSAVYANGETQYVLPGFEYIGCVESGDSSLFSNSESYRVRYYIGYDDVVYFTHGNIHKFPMQPLLHADGSPVTADELEVGK